MVPVRVCIYVFLPKIVNLLPQLLHKISYEQQTVGPLTLVVCLPIIIAAKVRT